MNHKARRITAIVIALLVPLAALGTVLWTLHEPAERTATIKAAVVNNDEPVKINGKPAPLGRQLTAKLAGSAIKDNYHWEVATAQTAAQGMRDGEYVATVVIPKNFSRAATSYARDPAQARRARIEVTTTDRGNLVDEAVSKQIADSAARLLGRDLGAQYLDNLYLGFNKLHDQLGKAAGGAGSLAGGARKLAGGTEKLSAGAEKLAGGNRQLADGIGGLDAGIGTLSGGASGLADGLGTLRDKTAALPDQVGKLADGADKQAAGLTKFSGGLGKFSDGMQLLAQNCPPTALTYCDAVRQQAAAAQQLDAGAGKLSVGGTGIAKGVHKLSDGLPALSSGVDKLAGGAEKLASGVDKLHGGTTKTKAGADKLADGVQGLAGGTGSLSGGAKKLGDGTAKLGDGLDQAVTKLPTYDDSARDKLSTVVADPVTASADAPLGLGAGSVARYAVLALWLGGFALFLVLRPTPRRTLESTRPTPLLLLRAVRLPALLAVVQAAAVTVLLGLTNDLSTAEWFGCAGLAALIALACTALNQALAAAWPTVGRFAAVLVALVLLGASFTAISPLNSVAALLPLGSATEGLRALLGGPGSAGGTAAAMVLWAVIGLVVTYLAVERGRTVRRGELLGGVGLHRLRTA